MTEPHVRLAVVDESLLEQLTTVAVSDAAASDVTPALTAGDTWTSERIAWFRAYHRGCRAGLEGPAGEAAWAVLVEDRPVGAVRLRRRGHDRTLEAGIWLAKSARGRQLAHTAIRLLIAQARDACATAICADTSPRNDAALALMRSLGFQLSTDLGQRVHGRLDLPNR